MPPTSSEEALADALVQIVKVLDDHRERIEGLERQLAATLPLLSKLLKALEDDS